MLAILRSWIMAIVYLMVACRASIPTLIDPNSWWCHSIFQLPSTLLHCEKLTKKYYLMTRRKVAGKKCQIELWTILLRAEGKIKIDLILLLIIMIRDKNDDRFLFHCSLSHLYTSKTYWGYKIFMAKLKLI